MAHTGILFSLAILFAASPAVACEPCAKTNSLAETIKKSDLIIIGERADYTENEISNKGVSGPEFINIRVKQTLKGDVSTNSIIKAHSWYGMCSYGIYLNKPEQAVLYLSKKGDAYDSVENGCAEKSSTIIDGQIYIENKKISIEDFKKTYLRDSR